MFACARVLRGSVLPGAVESFVWCDASLGCQSTTDRALCEANPDCDPDATEGCDPTVCLAEV